MAFDARTSELREMVRNEYPGDEVGTVDEATARGKEKKVVLEAIEKWASARASRLTRLAEIVESTNGSAEKDFESEAAAARADMVSIFADCLRTGDVKTPTMLGLKVVVGGATEEEKFYAALVACKAVATAIDSIVRYNRELVEKTDALKAKWAESERYASDIKRNEHEALDEIERVKKETIAAQADRHMSRREKFRAWVKASKDALALVTSAGAAAIGVPVPPEFIKAGKEVLDKGSELTEAWGKMAGDLEARKQRYENYFTQDHASLLVMFRGTRTDAQAFLEQHDYTRLVLDWTSKGRSAIDALRSAATTSGQKSDADALAGRFSSALERAERDAKSRWDVFVSENQTKFFGAFSPDVERALIGTDWDDRYRKIASLDLQGLLQRWIGDDKRDFGEVDWSEMPETWRDELRAQMTASLEKLAQTEEEIARNNSPDALMIWIKGKPAELVNKLR